MNRETTIETTMLLEGIFPAMTTPFYPDGRLNPLKLEHNVARMSLTPAAGMVMLGSTGEAVLLREAEQEQVLRTAIDAAAKDKVMIAGVGQESAAATLAMAGTAAQLGYDVVLVRTPSFYRRQMQPAEMLNYFRQIADRSALPVLLYSNTACTGYSLPVEIAAELAQHANILGIKDSSGDVERIGQLVAATRQVSREVNVTTTFFAVTGRAARANTTVQGMFVSAESLAGGTAVATAVPPTPPALRTRTKKAGFQVLAGSASSLRGSLEAGASGAVLALAAAAPGACFEVYAAQREGDAKLADEKQARLVPASDVVVAQLGVPAVKYAAELNGYFGGNPRVPLLPLSAEQRALVEDAMRDLRA